jgi:hypothetical protein
MIAAVRECVLARLGEALIATKDAIFVALVLSGKRCRPRLRQVCSGPRKVLAADQPRHLAVEKHLAILHDLVLCEEEDTCMSYKEEDT